MAYGTSSLGRVRSELPSWRRRTASGSLRTPGESTLAPRSSNATDFNSYASQDRFSPLFGQSCELGTVSLCFWVHHRGAGRRRKELTMNTKFVLRRSVVVLAIAFA